MKAFVIPVLTVLTLVCGCCVHNQIRYASDESIASGLSTKEKYRIEFESSMDARILCAGCGCRKEDVENELYAAWPDVFSRTASKIVRIGLNREESTATYGHLISVLTLSIIPDSFTWFRSEEFSVRVEGSPETQLAKLHSFDYRLRGFALVPFPFLAKFDEFFPNQIGDFRYQGFGDFPDAKDKLKVYCRAFGTVVIQGIQKLEKKASVAP